MSEPQTNPRRRRIICKNRQRTRPPTPSSSYHRRTSVSRRLKASKPIKVDLQRCHSEPIPCTIGVVFDDEDENGSKLDGILFGPQSCLNFFVPQFMSPFASVSERYTKDAKVVVNVTVEGSSGPVRTLVKLGASVEDTIKLVVDKYTEEGRSPRLGCDGVSSFELHQSHFSLERISKKDAIGNVGTRSFYLRKTTEDCGPCSSATEVVPPFVFTPALIARKMSKIGRRMRSIWKVLGCSP